MSERINVDHAFDPEARQAQAELDAYMDSRTFYKDENDKIHDANDGQKFTTKEAMNAHHDAKRDEHYDATLQEGDYSNESLEQLAKRVAQARAEGDKTRAGDAEEAFFNKFAEYSEKYGWEDDDSANETASVNHAKVRDRQAGRSTIDDRLERYTKIMYGEDASEARVEEARDEVEAAIEHAAETDTESVEEAAEPTPEVDESDADRSADEVDKPVSIDDQVAAAKERLNAQAEARAEQAVADMNETDQAKADRELLNPVSTEGLEPVDDASAEADGDISLEGLEPVDAPNEDPAHEGESLEEYEARHGVENDAETAELEAQADEDGYVKPSLRSRIRRWLTPSGVSANLAALSHTQRERLRERKHGRATLIIGGLAVAGAGVAGYMLLRNSGHDGGGHGAGNWFNDLFGDAAEKAKDATGDKPRGGGGSGVNWNDFDPSARNVTKGEGWYSTFQQMGIPKEHWSGVLNDAGPKLGRLGEAYFDNSSNEWRISNPGRLSGESLRVIAAAAKRDGVDLAS